jgi:hypothetical protein
MIWLPPLFSASALTYPDAVALAGDTALDSTASGGRAKYWNGTVITAVYTGTCEVAWSHIETGRIDSREIGIGEGKMSFISCGARVVVLYAATGAQIWQDDAASVMSAIEKVLTSGDPSPVGNPSGMICSPVDAAGDVRRKWETTGDAGVPLGAVADMTVSR